MCTYVCAQNHSLFGSSQTYFGSLLWLRKNLVTNYDFEPSERVSVSVCVCGEKQSLSFFDACFLHAAY